MAPLGQKKDLTLLVKKKVDPNIFINTLKNSMYDIGRKKCVFVSTLNEHGYFLARCVWLPGTARLREPWNPGARAHLPFLPAPLRFFTLQEPSALLCKAHCAVEGKARGFVLTCGTTTNQQVAC